MSPKKIVFKYASDSIWINSESEWKDILARMIKDLSKAYGKDTLEFTLNDMQRVLSDLEASSSKLGMNKVSYYKIQKIKYYYSSFSEYSDLISFIYSAASLFTGNTGPLIRKLGINFSGQKAVYFSLTYLAGYYACELYGGKNFKTEQIENTSDVEKDEVLAFDPIFALLNTDHIKDLLKILKIKADINDDVEDIKIKIINELKYLTKNTVKHLIDKFSSNDEGYRQTLLAVCSEYKIEISQGNTVEQIEDKIVMKVFQETVSQMNDEEKKKLEEKLQQLNIAKFDSQILTSGGILAGLLTANASGFGIYLAASSALGAITNGLGITLAFSTYTTMSTALSVLLGPWGIGAATLGLLATIFRSTPKKAVPAIIYIAMQRKSLSLEDKIKKVPLKKRKLWKIIWTACFLLMGAGISYYIFEM